MKLKLACIAIEIGIDLKSIFNSFIILIVNIMSMFYYFYCNFFSSFVDA